jgi:hypothetical protein
MKPPCGCAEEDEEGGEVGEFGGVGVSSAGGSPLVREFLSRTHLCRLEEEESSSLDLAMDERDMLYTEARVEHCGQCCSQIHYRF